MSTFLALLSIANSILIVMTIINKNKQIEEYEKQIIVLRAENRALKMELDVE